MLMASQTLIRSHKITVMTSQTQFGSHKTLIRLNQELIMASQTLIGSHKIIVLTSHTQFGSHKRVIRGNQEAFMAIQTDKEPQNNSHDIPDSVWESKGSNQEVTRNAHGIADSDLEPQDNSHDIPEGVIQSAPLLTCQAGCSAVQLSRSHAWCNVFQLFLSLSHQAGDNVIQLSPSP